MVKPEDQMYQEKSLRWKDDILDQNSKIKDMEKVSTFILSFTFILYYINKVHSWQLPYWVKFPQF